MGTLQMRLSKVLLMGSTNVFMDISMFLLKKWLICMYHTLKMTSRAIIPYGNSSLIFQHLKWSANGNYPPRRQLPYDKRYEMGKDLQGQRNDNNHFR